ncbi:hypothetical protein BQ8482_111766 [Mesorhizobium delmotii]|uniref:Uncharacterized protein n=1 Tax=Mesorhizobium delmotii TaxID=1631247 RepID=A0A2P9AFC8_9HYPH|nr:hypothetical protein BQ8482_111766 [Mesorhizobium delmotii]
MAHSGLEHGGRILLRPCPTTLVALRVIGQFCMGRQVLRILTARPWCTTPKNLAGLWLSFLWGNHGWRQGSRVTGV